jgi:hypothetical protein
MKAYLHIRASAQMRRRLHLVNWSVVHARRSEPYMVTVNHWPAPQELGWELGAGSWGWPGFFLRNHWPTLQELGWGLGVGNWSWPGFFSRNHWPTPRRRSTAAPNSARAQPTGRPRTHRTNNSAVVWLVGVPGARPGDPSSGPGGGIFLSYLEGPDAWGTLCSPALVTGPLTGWRAHRPKRAFGRQHGPGCFRRRIQANQQLPCGKRSRGEAEACAHWLLDHPAAECKMRDGAPPPARRDLLHRIAAGPTMWCAWASIAWAEMGGSP